MRRQEGSCGWRRAQDSFLRAGLAEEVMGAMARTVRGRVCFEGKRMGEMKGLLV